MLSIYCILSKRLVNRFPYFRRSEIYNISYNHLQYKHIPPCLTVVADLFSGCIIYLYDMVWRKDVASSLIISQ